MQDQDEAAEERATDKAPQRTLAPAVVVEPGEKAADDRDAHRADDVRDLVDPQQPPGQRAESGRDEPRQQDLNPDRSRPKKRLHLSRSGPYLSARRRGALAELPPRRTVEALGSSLSNYSRRV